MKIDLHSRKNILFFLSVVLCMGWLGLRILHPAAAPSAVSKACAKSWADPPVITTFFPEDEPASRSPLLAWTKNLEAVAYEVEFFETFPVNLSDLKISKRHSYATQKIFTNAFNPDLDVLFPEAANKPLYWRVRALDENSHPISRFSSLEPLYTDAEKPKINAPVPLAVYDRENGHNLLYPVYSWVPNAGAMQYEVEVLSQPPENPQGTEPSRYRIFSIIAPFGEQYDPQPRFGSSPYYWRVRALDAKGDPVGVYSAASSILLNPAENWGVGIYGDSISHGGGHLSYGPADWEYSYASYLDFPTVNLSQSGDTSEDMVKRFDQDVLPFHPAYLLILGGSNSLRGGVPAAAVIQDLERIRDKCEKNGIRPIFLTLPPIHPANIKAAFDEDTTEDWALQFSLVNDYIRTQVHIDLAAGMPLHDGLLPTEMGLDGLHPDVPGKMRMAEIINEHWAEAKMAADQAAGGHNFTLDTF